MLDHPKAILNLPTCMTYVLLNVFGVEINYLLFILLWQIYATNILQSLQLPYFLRCLSGRYFDSFRLEAQHHAEKRNRSFVIGGMHYL